MADGLDFFQDRIGYRFDDESLLELALVHASRDASKKATRSNERLEFLGDRVLGLVIAGMLYKGFPEENEGALSRRFAALVRKETLARVAQDLNLAAHLVMSRSENDTGGRENPTIMADACEAIIGAMFMDGGYTAARDFIEANWTPLLKENHAPPKDAKTALQEWSQGNGLGLPVYDILDNTGPSHAPMFRMTVSVCGLPEQVAAGPSKRKAEQAAAGQMLDYIAANDPRKFHAG